MGTGKRGTPVQYGSVCSGIEAASVAWHPLGWRAAWLAEIEPFPCAVLAHRFPGVPNLGDMTTIAARVAAGEVEAPDVLVGGTPCQSFSVAGLRRGLSDARGNLALSFVELANAIDARRCADGQAPAFVLWENVPGVLSSSDNAFGAFLAGLCGSDAALIPPGGGAWPDAGVVVGPDRCSAWRILDAQHFGVAQRRRRVFVLARGGAGDWSAADALLPVIESVRWHPPPRRAPREDAAGRAADSPGVCGTLNSNAKGSAGQDAGNGLLVPEVAGTLGSLNRTGGFRTTDIDGQGAFIPEVAYALAAGQGNRFGSGRDATNVSCASLPDPKRLPVPFDTTQVTSKANYSQPQAGDPCHPLAAGAHPPAIAFSIVPESGQGADLRATEVDLAPALTTEVDLAPALTTEEAKQQDRGVRVASSAAVRRLTEEECERLQGFPDGWTAIPGASNSARYRALGNSMAVPCMRYLGERIEAVR